MDERLEKAIKFSEYRNTINNQLELTKYRTKTALMYSTNGGTFIIDRALITFVEMLINREVESAVLMDENGLPIEIENLEEFQETLLDRYFSAMNDYHAEYERIRKARSVGSILDLEY